VATTCAACHATGVLGAPKLGDKAAWEPRLAQGFDTLAQHAIRGFKNMPARGGNASLTDDQMKGAVTYMLEKAGLAAPKAAESAQAAPAAPSAGSSGQPAGKAPGAPAASSGPDLHQGKRIYTQTCFACHGSGIAGAPKLGDATAWKGRIEKGMDALVKHAVQGFQGSQGVMPPKGGNPSFSDQQVADAVAYMVQQAK
jgi:cytochrome c5